MLYNSYIVFTFIYLHIFYPLLCFVKDHIILSLRLLCLLSELPEGTQVQEGSWCGHEESWIGSQHASAGKPKHSVPL